MGTESKKPVSLSGELKASSWKGRNGLIGGIIFAGPAVA